MPLITKEQAQSLTHKTLPEDIDYVDVKCKNIHTYEIADTLVKDEEGYIATLIYPNTSIRASNFKKFLNSFSATNPTSKERIPYNTWRTFVKVSETDKNDYYFILEPNDHIGIIIITQANDRKYESFQVTPAFYKQIRSFLGLTPQTKVRKEDAATMKSNAFSNISMPNIDFGPISSGVVISPYGLAVYNSNGQYLAYDAKSNKTIDVTGFTFSFPNMIYKMPVAANQIAAGDMVVHQGKILYITKVEDKNIEAIDIVASEAKTIIPISNVFGFNFVTKIVSLMNLNGMQPNEDNPFGNIMPMMMLSSMMNDENSDMGKMFMLSTMMGNNNPFTNMFNQQ